MKKKRSLRDDLKCSMIQINIKGVVVRCDKV